MVHSLFDTLVKRIPVNVGVKDNCRYDSSNLFIRYFDESLVDTLVKDVPINVGVKNDYRYRFNLVLNRRLFF